MSTGTVETVAIPTIVRIGDPIMTDYMGNLVWRGLSSATGFNRVAFGAGEAGFTGEPEAVAPLAVEATMNLKDPRISVTKQPENKPGSWVGPWCAVVADEEGKFVSWHRTKREGVERIARLLVVRDWHENGGVVEV